MQNKFKSVVRDSQRADYMLFSATVMALEELFATHSLKPGILPHFLRSSFSSSVIPGKVQDKISTRGLFTYPISQCEAKQLAGFSSAIAS